MSQKIIKFAIAFILLIIVATGIWLWFSADDDNSVATTVQQQEQQSLESDENTSAEIQSENEESTEVEEKENDTAVDTVPGNLNIIEGSDLQIDDTGQENGIIFVSASITSETEGDCIYNFTSEDTRPVTSSNAAFVQGDAYVCYVDINEAEFTKLGSWNAEVVFTSEGQSYKATEELNVQ